MLDLELNKQVWFTTRVRKVSSISYKTRVSLPTSNIRGRQQHGCSKTIVENLAGTIDTLTGNQPTTKGSSLTGSSSSISRLAPFLQQSQLSRQDQPSLHQSPGLTEQKPSLQVKMPRRVLEHWRQYPCVASHLPDTTLTAGGVILQTRKSVVYKVKCLRAMTCLLRLVSR
jgi:hypothetical protein